MSIETKRMLAAIGFAIALVLSVVRLTTWASRLDVKCAMHGSLVSLNAHVLGAALDLELQLPLVHEDCATWSPASSRCARHGAWRVRRGGA